MTKGSDVSIIIPNYNGKYLLEKNLPKVFEAYKNPENKVLEIIVVDDASKDDSVEFLQKSFPKIKLIKHKINRGFSSSVNTGVRSAKGKFLVLLNSDVAPERDFLVSPLNHFADGVFAISLREVNSGNQRGSWAKGFFKDGFVEIAPGGVTESIHDTFWVNGGSGVFRRDYWMDLGGMDEKLLAPFYWEDIDLSYRALKKGLHVLWDPSGRVFHQPESTISKLPKGYVDRVKERNQLLFIWKNITSPILFKKHLVGLAKRVLKHPGYVKVILLALTRIRSVLKARKKVAKEARVSDETIFAKFTDSK